MDIFVDLYFVCSLQQQLLHSVWLWLQFLRSSAVVVDGSLPHLSRSFHGEVMAVTLPTSPPSKAPPSSSSLLPPLMVLTTFWFHRDSLWLIVVWISDEFVALFSRMSESVHLSRVLLPPPPLHYDDEDGPLPESKRGSVT